MDKFVRLLILVFPVMLFAQTGSYDFKKAEKDTRQLIYRNPDSALVLIKRTLAQKGNFNDTIYGNTYNLYGMYYGMIGNADSSLYYFKKSLGYFKAYPRNKARGLTNIAISYRNKGDYKESLKYLNEALKLQRREKSQTGIAMVYGEMASVYNYQLKYKESIQYLLKAIDILKAAHNTEELVAIKQKLANTYLASENYEFAIDLYKECLPEFLKIGMEKNYYLTLVNLGEAYIRLEKFEPARKALKEAAEGLARYGDKELIGLTYSKVANIEQQTGQKNKAVDSYQKALDNLIEANSVRIVRIGGEYVSLLYNMKLYDRAAAVIARIEPLNAYNRANIQDRMVYDLAKGDAYSKTNNLQGSIDAYKNAIFILDTLRSEDTENAVKDVQAKFQNELQREQNIALEAKNKALNQSIATDKKLMLLYILISIATIILILLLLRGYWLKARLQKQALKTVESEKNRIQEQHKHEQELTNAQKEIIEEKQRELTSSTLRMANYQDGINNIIERCDTKTLKTAAEVKKELIKLSRQKDYWKQFETRFNSLHPEFSTTLTNRFEKLTKNDIEFCSLLKLNLSNKEIAALLQISHESAITKKYRIKKKMEINDDEEFEKLINEI